ncbi:hypothetical protein MHI18_16295 [Peribacillus sp. FSL H8-0477]
MDRNINQQPYQQPYQQQQQPSYAYQRPVKRIPKVKKDCGCNKGGYKR